MTAEREKPLPSQRPLFLPGAAWLFLFQLTLASVPAKWYNVIYTKIHLF